MTEENGQMPDMKDSEIKAANEYGIRTCLEKYDDPLDFLTYFMSCIDRKIIKRMVEIAIDSAANDCKCDHFNNLQTLELAPELMEAIKNQVIHTHGI